MGRNLWVFGGMCGHEVLDSVEVTDLVAGSRFETLNVPLMRLRASPVVCVLNDAKILIAGGSREGVALDDAIVLDIDSIEAKPAEMQYRTRGFASRGQTYKLRTGTVLSLTVSARDEVQLMVYSRESGLITRLVVVSQDPQ